LKPKKEEAEETREKEAEEPSVDDDEVPFWFDNNCEMK